MVRTLSINPLQSRLVLEELGPNARQASQIFAKHHNLIEEDVI
jgi:hypothetical protein|tara:strand:- start:314 stop:442 length:129 start_codon:yes stop_codon:yes gene_type:complete